MIDTITKSWEDFRTSPLLTVRNWQNHRLTWLIMLLTALFLESTAWYFQYKMFMDPCELCVYQRLAVLMLGTAAVIMLVAPRNKVVRGTGYLVWITGALYGWQAAIKQMGYYANSDLLMTCKALPTFPFDLPLYEWWPDMFLPSGFCGEDDWLFLGLNMANWMSFIFSIYVVAFALCVISFFRKNDR